MTTINDELKILYNLCTYVVEISLVNWYIKGNND